MKLNYKKFGDSGSKLIIIHGLLGSLDNWQTLAKRYADHFQVYTIDVRNHGKSPHSPDFSYDLMVKDLEDFYEHHTIEKANIIGHSMGAKIAMNFALSNPSNVETLVSADMSPVAGNSDHDFIFKALNSIDMEEVQNRSDAEDQLKHAISDFGIRQFLLKNLDRKKDGSYEWKMNLKALSENYESILEEVRSDNSFDGPTLFIKGGKSGYIKDEHEAAISGLFPNVQFATIENAGHWLHAEKPDNFFDITLEFVKKNA